MASVLLPRKETFVFEVPTADEANLASLSVNKGMAEFGQRCVIRFLPHRFRSLFICFVRRSD